MIKYLQRTTSGAAGSGRAKRSSTCDVERAATRASAWAPNPTTCAAPRATAGQNDQVPSAHDVRRRGKRPKHYVKKYNPAIWRVLFLAKKTLHRHRVGFEPQRASLFWKWVKASQIFGEAVRAQAIIPLFVVPFTLMVVLACSTSGGQHFCVNVCCTEHHPIRIGDEQKRLVNKSLVTTKSWGPS
jgi:hypothetical protein